MRFHSRGLVSFFFCFSLDLRCNFFCCCAYLNSSSLFAKKTSAPLTVVYTSFPFWSPAMNRKFTVLKASTFDKNVFLHVIESWHAITWNGIVTAKAYFFYLHSLSRNLVWSSTPSLFVATATTAAAGGWQPNWAHTFAARWISFGRIKCPLLIWWFWHKVRNANGKRIIIKNTSFVILFVFIF